MVTGGWGPGWWGWVLRERVGWDGAERERGGGRAGGAAQRSEGEGGWLVHLCLLPLLLPHRPRTP
eukprot:3857773-Rhodomonas_salina.2